MSENTIATLIREHRVLLEYAINDVIAQFRNADASSAASRQRVLDYEEIHQLIDAARAHALRLNIAVVVALCDRRGEFIMSYRMPGTAVGDIAAADNNAVAAVLSAAADDEHAADPRAALDLDRGYGNAPGASPVYVAGKLAGGIGVSGGSAEQNHQVALHAARLLAQQIAPELAHSTARSVTQQTVTALIRE